MIGTNGNDRLLGSSGNDTINPLFGHDTVDGGLGDDLLVVDYSTNLFPGTPDRPAGMSFYSGAPNLDVTTGRQVLENGGVVANKIITDNDSVAFRDMERFFVTGTIGNDTLSVFADWFSNDTLNGLDGDDVIASGAGDDSIAGGSGNDTIYGGIGNDFMDGGTGNDEIFTGVSGFNGTQSDTALGGAGIDTLRGGDFSAATSALHFTDDGSTQMAVALAHGTTASGFEFIDEIATGSGADSILFSHQRRTNLIRAGAGDDTVNSGLGNDTVDGGWGNDLLVVDYSQNTFAGDATRQAGMSFYSGSTTTEAASGRDYLASGGATANRAVGTDSMAISDFDRFQVTGTPANDTITIFYSWESNDTLSGGAGNDSIAAGSGNDCISGGTGNDTLYGEPGNDTLDGGAGADALYGGSGNDVFVVDQAADQVFEGANGGTDLVRAGITYTLGANVENLALTGTAAINGTGNALANSITGNAAANVLAGGAGKDTLAGGAGADTLTGFSGIAANGATEIDTLTGGAGADRFVLGNAAARFYDDGLAANAGRGSYALITDFTAGEDTLQLKGTAANYYLGTSGVAGVSGSGLFFEQGATDELVAIVRSANTTALTAANTINTAVFV